MKNKDLRCCPEFNPKKWDGKTFNWKNRQFIKESMRTFFHMPFPPTIRKKITKMWKMAEESKRVQKKKTDILILFTDPHPFKSEIYLSVTGKVQGANNVTLSGKFIGKVFDGPYNSIPKFAKEMDEYLSKKNKKAKKYYVHYAYCPKCAKKYGHNYMILFAEF